MSVVAGISCSTSAGVETKSTLVSGEDYQCSTEWRATSTCVGSGGQMSFAYDPSFSGPQTTVYCPYTKYPPEQAMTHTAKPPAPAPTAFNYPVQPNCSVQAPIHWEKTAMSNSSVTYSPGIGSKTEGAWEGQPTSRSYPMKNKKDSVPEYMGIRISIAHDERYCNSTQSENGALCEYSFKDEKRCSHWLLSTVNKCIPERLQQDQSKELWAGGSVNGDGLTWNVTDGKQCKPNVNPKGCWLQAWY